MALSPKHARFVAEYLKDLNASQAAVRAGYKGKPNTIGPRLLANVGIAAAVAEGSQKALEGSQASATRTIEEWSRIAYSDVTEALVVGSVAELRALPASVRACIASAEVVKRNLTSGDGLMDQVLKLKFWDKPKALDALSRYFGLDTQRVDVSGGVDVRWMMGDEGDKA